MDTPDVYHYDVKPKIDKEAELVYNAAVILRASGIEDSMAINTAFSLLTTVLKVQDDLIGKRLQDEARRRRGY